MSQFFTLLRKEILLEFRQRYAIGGILLYVVSTVFVVYLSFQQVKPPVWNALFWIISLFAAVNAVAKSFMQESGKRQLYYYSLASPIAIIYSKIFYNTLLLSILAVLTYATMSVLVSNPIVEPSLFWLTMLLSSVGFSITFTFISAIAAKANNSGTLMAVLSFPVILPILLELIRLTIISIGFAKDSSWYKDVLILTAIDFILLSMVYILFPFLWKE